MRAIILLLLLFCTLSAKHGLAQVPETKVSIPTKALSSSMNTGFSPYQNFTKLVATNDGTIALANINYRMGNAVNFFLAASSPVSSKTQQVKPLTISGLSSNSSVNIGAQKIFWDLGNNFKYDPLSLSNAIRAVGGDPDNFDYEKLSQKQKRIFDCKSSINWGTALFIGGKIGFEQQEFSYLIDSAKSDKYTDKSHLTTVASFTLGMLNRKTGIFSMTISYKDGYSAANPLTYSIATNQGMYIQKDLSPTPPTSSYSYKLRLEYLSYGGNCTNLRMNPNMTLDFTNKISSFQLPLYFLKTDDDKANFNGGIYAGYVTDKDYALNFKNENFGLGVFIGANINDIFN